MRERRVCRECGSPWKADPDAKEEECRTCHVLSEQAIARILESYRPLDDDPPDEEEES